MGNQNSDMAQSSHTEDLILTVDPSKLYESIVIIKWPNLQKFNASAMGIRFDSHGMVYLRPFPDTDTFDLLNNPEVEFITINFTDDVETFALAALSGLHAGPDVEEIDHSSFVIREGHAFLKNSQTVMLGRIITRNQQFQLRYDSSSFDDLNWVTSEFKVTFQIEQIKVSRTINGYQPVNRGDNLALEAIVYASKIPALQKLKSSHQKIGDYITRIKAFQFDIRRFSASKRALTVCNIIDNFLDRTMKKD